MICRAESGGIILFESQNSKTAFLSGNELDLFKIWLNTGENNAFIDRLRDLGIEKSFTNELKEDILRQIELSTIIKAPLRSFYIPESIHIDLTTKCNINCLQCYKGINESFELPYNFLVELINQAHELRVFQLAFGGGEPLLYPYLVDAIKLASKFGMACSITTNGVLLDSQMLKSLQEAGINHIQISLNGSNKNTHEKSRDCYDEALRALALLGMDNISFGINWVARKDNLFDFDNLITLAKDLKVYNVNVLRYKPSQSEEYDNVALTKDEFIFLANKINKIKNINIKIDSAYSNLLCFIYGSNINSAFSGCGAGRRFFSVCADGSFKGCSHSKDYEYNTSIMDFWENSNLLNQFRIAEEKLTNQCNVCKNMYKCVGCRVICEYKNNYFFAGEVDCPAYIGRY